VTKPSRNSDHAAIEQAFQRARAELGIRTGFPDEVLREAEQVTSREPKVDAGRVDRADLALVTIDPPGSQDLDQAVHAERTEGGGYRVHYAIADVGFFVDRGSALEREAWLRGVTFYAPDHREPLYPPTLSEGGASLLPEVRRPAILFTLDLDERAELISVAIARALVFSRAQLTYSQLLNHVQGNAPVSESLGASTLSLLGEIGPKRLALEVERGGVSLPLRDQHVQQRAAAQLGYELVYEEPSEAERWNAQISLVTGHAAALQMLEARVGLLRTLAPPREDDVRKFRIAAQALGFRWPNDLSYTEFIRDVDLDHPHIETLIWQARRVMRGAGYLAFHEELPPQPVHAALAFAYSHCTAPLRRLADRYVLDLLVDLAADVAPADAHVQTLRELPSVMEEADRRSHALERKMIDVAEAWTLRGREGDRFPATVLDVRADRIDAQIEEPPVRAKLPAKNGSRELALGEQIQVRLQSVEVAKGSVRFELQP
jgi:exoribonuclease R